MTLPEMPLMVEKLPHHRDRTILLLTPTFVPDPASVGQHMADLAVELARRGHRVQVFTARNGYDDPSQVYPDHEIFHGVRVKRFPFSSFGKASLLRRLFGTLAFMSQCIVHGLFAPKLGAIVITTSPPLSDLAGVILASFRRVPVVYWGMDLYVAQMLALDKFKQRGLAAKMLVASQRFILRRCTMVVALDRFMAQRLRSWGVQKSRLLIIPPWPHEDHLHATTHENPFRERHNLQGKFIVMYSGNHSTSNPLTTLLEAAVRLKDDPQIVFLFVGGGNGKREVEEVIRTHNLTNAISLPYQPLSELRYSLSSANVHVVALGEKMVGIIHPCKVYGAMAIGRPILYFGPASSHIADLLNQHEFGLHVSHGDVTNAVAAINYLRSADPAELERVGKIGQTVLRENLSQQILSARFCDGLEKILR
jgi:colanic acid biosynthesis glycosyl transferase WcaI